MNYTVISPQKATAIPERVIAYINAVPPAVSGNDGHGQTFKLAQTLVNGFCLNGNEALGYLENEFNPRCDPTWPRRDLVHKVNEAISKPSSKPRGWMLEKGEWKPSRLTRKPVLEAVKPPVDTLANMRKFVGDFQCTEQEVINASPYKLPPLIHGTHFHRQGAYLIETLFEKDDLVNIVSNSKQNEKGKWYPVGYGKTLPRNEWTRRLLKAPSKRSEGAWYRFNPMGSDGITDKNVTAFRYVLIEFDDIPMDLQISLLAKLLLPIAAITCTGGRGYHALAKIDVQTMGQYRETVQSIYDLMKLLGIDTKNRNPSRMSRLPGVMRGVQQQRLVYLNPEPLAKGIL